VVVSMIRLLNRRVRSFILLTLHLTRIQGFCIQGAINIGSPVSQIILVGYCSSYLQVPRVVFVPTQPVEIKYVAVYFARKDSRATILYGHPAFDQYLEQMLRKHLGESFLEWKKIDPTVSIVDITIDETTKSKLSIRSLFFAMWTSLNRTYTTCSCFLRCNHANPRRVSSSI
jgi:hypothetical protein